MGCKNTKVIDSTKGRSRFYVVLSPPPGDATRSPPENGVPVAELPGAVSSGDFPPAVERNETFVPKEAFTTPASTSPRRPKASRGRRKTIWHSGGSRSDVVQQLSPGHAGPCDEMMVEADEELAADRSLPLFFENRKRVIPVTVVQPNQVMLEEYEEEEMDELLEAGQSERRPDTEEVCEAKEAEQASDVEPVVGQDSLLKLLLVPRTIGEDHIGGGEHHLPNQVMDDSDEVAELREAGQSASADMAEVCEPKEVKQMSKLERAVGGWGKRRPDSMLKLCVAPTTIREEGGSVQQQEGDMVVEDVEEEDV